MSNSALQATAKSRPRLSAKVVKAADAAVPAVRTEMEFELVGPITNPEVIAAGPGVKILALEGAVYEGMHPAAQKPGGG